MTAPRQYYDDGLIQLDREAITLRRYHFPSGTSKVIPLRSISGYRAESLGLVLNRFRIWGSSDLRRWLPLDVWRPIKSTLITLKVKGTRPDPAFTRSGPRSSSRYSTNCWGARRQRAARTTCRSSEAALEALSYTRTMASSPGLRKVDSPNGV